MVKKGALIKDWNVYSLCFLAPSTSLSFALYYTVITVYWPLPADERRRAGGGAVISLWLGHSTLNIQHQNKQTKL